MSKLKKIHYQLPIFIIVFSFLFCGSPGLIKETKMEVFGAVPSGLINAGSQLKSLETTSASRTGQIGSSLVACDQIMFKYEGSVCSVSNTYGCSVCGPCACNAEMMEYISMPSAIYGGAGQSQKFVCRAPGFMLHGPTGMANIKDVFCGYCTTQFLRVYSPDNCKFWSVSQQ